MYTPIGNISALLHLLAKHPKIIVAAGLIGAITLVTPTTIPPGDH